jgi:hypothetical protein
MLELRSFPISTATLTCVNRGDADDGCRKLMCACLRILLAPALSGCVQGPDLVPANPHGWAAFCELDGQQRIGAEIQGESAPRHVHYGQ